LRPVTVGQRQLWYFDEDDEEFVRVGVADAVGGQLLLRLWNTDGTVGAGFGIDSSGAGVFASDTQNGEKVAAITAHNADSAGGYLNILLGGSGFPPEVAAIGFQWFAGSVDPSAGGGIGGEVGSVYTRVDAGSGELWFKTGAADTDWTKLTP
jgi:hypothetical protein